MLWFYAPSIALFGGACSPAGSRAAVPSCLLKEASLLGSRRTLLFQPASAPQQFWAVLSSAVLRELLGLQNTLSQALATHVHSWVLLGYGWIAFLSQRCGAPGQPGRQKLRQQTQTVNHCMCPLTTISACPALPELLKARLALTLGRTEKRDDSSVTYN